MKKFTIFCILCTVGMIVFCSKSFGQTSDSTRKDTAVAKDNFVTKMQRFAQISAKKSAEEFNADKAVMAQGRILEEVKKVMQKAKSYLKTAADTTGAKTELAQIEKDYNAAVDGVMINKGTAQTFRNLTATAKILSELLNKSLARKAKLDIQQQSMTGFRYQLDSLTSLPELFKFPTDSAELYKYLQQLKVVAIEISPIDSALKISSKSVQLLLNQVNVRAFTLQATLDEISHYQAEMGTNMFNREFANIWEEAGSYRPFREILEQGKTKGLLTLVFYVQNNIGKLIVLVLLILASFTYLRSLKKIYIENNMISGDYEGQLVLRYPLASAVLIVISIFQFIFFSPPFILNIIFWVLCCLSLTIMFRRFIVKYWMNVWLSMVALFLMAALDNLVLQASRTERWIMLFLAISGVIAGIYVLTKGRREELREKLILIAISLMVAIEFSSAICNIFGRYNLAKALLISGYLNVVVAILFLWTIRLINEGLFLAFNIYTKQELKLFYLNFAKVGKTAPLYFYVLLITGWIILFGRNFAGFDYIAGPLREFFNADRTIGSYTFSINGLLLFFVIMSIAVVISKIVSFFASDRHLTHTKEEKNIAQGIGSWLLLVRITILSIGLFLAVAAAGIPLDRITIVLGALGVGIGFGLQALVNNLVSGLIIAFEKPVNVGDVVEVDGQGGTVKSIGFRSSVVSTYDGADVIMPNGDLLNSHLTNWSLGGNRRRSTLLIGVSYDSDLEQAKKILSDILAAEHRLTTNPAPIVQYEQFNDSSIDVRIFFWAKSMRDSPAVKSDLIMAINAAFKLNKISIPFPQHDVHLPNLTTKTDIGQ
ncbi:mechanosensitive ion channel [Pedobacter sp. MC2016-14]|uniref:mechanosensitive ion channel family protein n=1 Tax=Pedobacter sp. MC2016-14 TaxID=2897327 RepID=UPI001E5A29D8|nr:mechanosensitive ion channel domain-containing protein [Pedobacter sp. MC2016-14]MCD0488069.1 mechanosensitive ion channel [Pedobacter sp. MC2016-14]